MSSSNWPEVLASKLLTHLKIKPPIPIEEVAGALGLHIRAVKLSAFEGVIFPWIDAAGGIVAVQAGNTGTSRQRFTIAHEIGHYVLSRRRPRRFLCPAGDIGASGRKEENAANRFAAELLLPASFVLPIVRKRPVSIETARTISDQFKTSLTAAAFKCVEVAEEECALVVTVDGKIQSYRPSASWRYIIFTKCPLGHGTLARQLSQNRGTNQRMGTVSAMAWASGDRYMEVGAQVLEDSILLPGYNTILTFLTALQ